jgi:hypothetical protein
MLWSLKEHGGYFEEFYRKWKIKQDSLPKVGVIPNKGRKRGEWAMG